MGHSGSDEKRTTCFQRLRPFCMFTCMKFEKFLHSVKNEVPHYLFFHHIGLYFYERELNTSHLMYTLLSGLWKYLFQKDEYYVLILGLDNAGKTTYLEQTKTKFHKNYQGMNFSKITSTVGLNIGKIDIGNVRLNFWDLGGQEELQSLWDKYYAESHAVIYIVDTSDKDRLDESKIAFDKMIKNDLLSGVPLLLLGNKQDLDSCITIGTMKEMYTPVKEIIGERDCNVLGASALKGDGVMEGIHWLVECIKKNSLNRPPTPKDIT